MKRVVLDLDAQIELAEVLLWLSEHSTEHGKAFADAYDAIERRIADNPMQFPEIEPGVRRALIRRFHYSVYFILEDDEAVIMAVAHQRRRPGYWRDRLH